MDRERFILGRDAIFANYCRVVDPLYQNNLHDEGCPKSCPCHRDSSLRGQLIQSRYEQFQKQIHPHMLKAVALIAELRRECSA